MLAAYLFASKGDRRRIEPWILELRPEQSADGDQAYWIGGIRALLGEKEASLTWLRRAAALGNHNYPWFARDKNYDRLRGDADYERIMAGIRREWERYVQLFG